MISKIDCFVCGEKTQHNYIATRGDGVKLYKCTSCKTIKVEDIEKVFNNTEYNSNYFKSNGTTGYGNYLTTKIKSIINNEFDPYRITKNIIKNEFVEEKNIKILEVGCAYGLFNLITDDNFEYHGIDINHESITVAKDIFNFTNIRSDNLFDLRETYDVIFMNDVIEHIKEPSQFLSKIHELLTDKGIFILSTPNAELIDINDSWIGINGSYEHIYFFTENSLDYILQKNNYITKFKQYDFSRNYNINIYKCELRVENRF